MLTAEQAALVKGMLARGDKQHDIAAFFGENGGRIGELASGYITRKGHPPKPHPFRNVKPAPQKDLPPRSALVGGYGIYHARQALLRARVGIDQALAYLADAETGRDLQ